MKFNEILIKNNVFRENIKAWNYKLIKNNSEVEGLLKKLRDNKYDIFEKQYGKISSFNFNRKVFHSKKWNDLSKLARGLFIDNQTGNIKLEMKQDETTDMNYSLIATQGKFEVKDYQNGIVLIDN